MRKHRILLADDTDDIRAVFQEGLDFSTVLLDVMTIADEVDSQLKRRCSVSWKAWLRR